jgi:hypothetical protein
MRILQQFPLADDPSLAGAVSAVLQRIIAVRASSVRRCTALLCDLCCLANYASLERRT